MELYGIFVNDYGEGLHAIKYADEPENEYDRLFNLWIDAFYLQKFFIENKAFINDAFFERMWIDDLISKVIKEADEMIELLSELTDENASEKLESLFKPLDDREYKIYSLQETKAKIIDSHKFRKPILRLYAIRIDEKTFVITGGAIKITEKMSDHPSTIKELEKLSQAKRFLIENNLINSDEIIYYYDTK